MSSNSSTYAFGDTALAARRLELVADTFEPVTRKLLARVPGCAAKLSKLADLGCAHGRSTELLSETLGADRSVGLDQSEAFLALAQRRASQRIGFHRHDITQLPFPEAPFDLIFCRLLLSHLADGLALLERWASQLDPGGLLAIEEVAWIHSEEEVFRRYLSLVQGMLEERGQALYIGQQLAKMADPPGLRRREDELIEFPVEPARAAALFSLNAQVWRDSPYVTQSVGEIGMAELERALGRIRDATAPGDSIVWGIRQLIFERV